MADSFEGQRLQDIVAPEAVAGCRATLQAASATGYSAGHQFALILQGRPYWFELSIARKSGPSESIQRFIELSRDITERKQAEARSHHLAYFDALTQLPNRRMLLDRTEQAVAGARKSGQIGALLFVDLDNFKQINDARGHAVGDAMLKRGRAAPAGFAAPRGHGGPAGGDEFVMLLGQLGLTWRVQGALRCWRLKPSAPRWMCPTTSRTTTTATPAASASRCSPSSRKAEDLLREADTAMYRAKDMGRNRIRFMKRPCRPMAGAPGAGAGPEKASAEGQLAVFVQS